MSGSTGYTIPAEFDFGSSAERAAALEQIFRRLITQANQLSSSFSDPRMERAGQSLLKQMRDALSVMETTARAVQTVSSEIRTLNAQSVAARNVARANREAEIQGVSRRGSIPGLISGATSIESLNVIQTALQRDIEKIKASRRELARIRDGIAEGDSDDAKQRIRQLDSQARRARESLAQLETRRGELSRIEADQAARQRDIINIQRRIDRNRDATYQELKQQERASRPVLPAAPPPTFAQQVGTAAERARVWQAVQSQLALDPVAQRNAIDRRQSQVRTNLAADETMDPSITNRRMALARNQSQEFLFGDGGERLFQTQGRLLAQYAVLNQIQQAFVGLTSAVVDYDKALRNLQAISGSTDTQMKQMSATIVAVSRNTKFTAVELADISTTLAQAGLSIGEINQSLRSVALLATASGSSLATAADVFTSALGVFRLRAQESTSVANQMVAALNLSKLTMEQLALGIQYSANVAADSNISFTELTAALSTMANAGIRSGSTLGTGLRQLMIDLESPSEKLTERLRSLGLTTDDVNVRTRGLRGALQTLRDAGFSTVDALSTMEVRAAAAFAALSRGLDDMGRLEEQIRVFNGAAEANEIQMRALSNAAIAFSNNLKAIAVEATTNTLAALTSLVKAMADATGSTSNNAAAIQALGDVMATFAAFMVGAWLLRVTGALTAVSAAFAAGRTAAIAFTAAAAIAGPVTASASAVSSLAVAVRSFALSVPGLAIISGLAFAAYNLADGSRAAANAQNELREKVGNAQATVDEAKRNYEAVSEQVVRLTARQRDLRDGSSELENAVSEMRDRFKDLDTTVFANINTFDGLVGALNRLRAGINSGLVGDLLKLRDALRESIGSDEARIGTALGGVRSLRSQGQTPFASPDAQAVSQNDTVRAAFALADRTAPPSLDEVRGILQRLRGVADANRGSTLGTTATQLIAQFSTIESAQSSIAVNRGQLTSVGDRVRLSELRDDPRFQAALTAYSTGRGAAEGRRQVSDLTPDELAGGGRVGEFRSTLNTSIATLNEYLNALSPEDRRLASSELRVADLNSLLRDFDKSIADRVSGRAVAIADVETRTTQREIERLLEEAGRGSTTAERRGQIRALLSGPQGLLATLQQNRLAAFENSSGYRSMARTEPDVAARQRTLTMEDARGERSRYLERLTQVENADRVRSIDARLAAARARQREARSRVGRGTSPQARAAARADLEAANVAVATLEREKAELAASGTSGLRGEAADLAGQAALNSFDRAGVGGGRSGALGDDELRSANDRAIFQDRFRIIERNAQVGERAANGQTQSERAFLDFAGRRPDLVPEAVAFRSRRLLNALEVSAEQASLATQTLRAQQLQDLASSIRQRRVEIDRRIEEYENRIRNASGQDRADQVRRLNELRAQRDALVGGEGEGGEGGLLGQVQTALTDAERARGQAQNNADARRRGDGLTTGNAYEAAVYEFDEKNGVNASRVSAWATNFRESINGTRNALNEFFTDFAMGTKRSGDLFRDLANGMLRSMLNVVTNRVANQFLSLVLNTVARVAVGSVTGGSTTDNVTDTTASFDDGSAYRYHGGAMVQRFSGGGRVRGTNIGRDTVRAMVAPDEYIVSARGHQLVGTEALDAINRGQVAAVRQAPAGAGKQRDPDNVNVYIVSPEQKPSLGPKDVLAIIGDDMVTGGRTRQLVRSIQLGVV